MFRTIFLFVFLVAVTFVCTAQLKRYSFSHPKMGSPFTIIFYTTDSAKAGIIASLCYQRVDSLVNIFSDYIDSSELNRLCASANDAHKNFIVSPALFDILWLSKSAYEKSKGSFDITLGPVTRLWRKARKEHRFPEDSLVKLKLATTGFDKIKMDSNSHVVSITKPGMQLDLGGIAQGYIAQKTIDFLKSNEIDCALVDVSGDIVCIGKPPGSKGWKVGINVPESEHRLLNNILQLSNLAVTTSGDVYQYMEHNGKRYSHIINPTTGYGITSRRNVTVIAADGTTADWFTKACSLLSIAASRKLAAELKVEFLIAEIISGKIVFHATKGFGRYWEK